ncbi:MAG TPA: hypothetical protein VIS30_08210, partial [Candidatus Deferrimicrobiaceae bacterium]
MGPSPAPISKKAPGDRQISFEEIRRIAGIIRERDAEGKVSDLPPTVLKELLAILRKRPVPPLLAR